MAMMVEGKVSEPLIRLFPSGYKVLAGEKRKAGLLS